MAERIGIGLIYLLKVEAIKIGDSASAPLLTLIVGPSEEGRKVGETKEEIVERQALRYEFWKQLLERAKSKTRLHASISPGVFSYIGTGAGRSGLSYAYSIRQNAGQVDLYIDRGKDSEKENKAIFEAISKDKDEIERMFGGALDWQRLDGKRACRIRYVISLGGYRDDQAKWPQIQDAMIDAMIRLNKALKPHVDKLEL